MKKEIDKICFLDTVYSLLLYLLIIDENEIDKTYFIFSNRLDKSIRDKFSNKYVYNFFNYQKNYTLKMIYYFIVFNTRFGKLSRKKIYGNHQTRLSYIFLKHKNFYVIEDGTMNYQTYNFKTDSKLKKIIKKIFLNDYNLNNAIKKHYLTGICNVPDIIKDKTEIIDLKRLWKETNQEKILNIFSFDKNIIEKASHINYVLFTQPLSEDKIISEEEKISIYYKIISKYDKNKLLIKTHPREKTNYQKLFADIEIINNPVPAELLKLLIPNIKTVITLFSTAALGWDKNVKIHWYGNLVTPNLKLFYQNEYKEPTKTL